MLKKIKKSTTAATNVDRNNHFGVWETIDLLTKHHTHNHNSNNNNPGRGDVYNNIQDWLLKVTTKLNENNKRIGTIHKKPINLDFINSSPDELIPSSGGGGLDSETYNSSTPSNGKMNVQPDSTKHLQSSQLNGRKSKKMNRTENSIGYSELYLPLNGLSDSGGGGGGGGGEIVDKKTKKKKKKCVKLPKINKNKKFKDGPPLEDEEMYKTNYFGSLVDCNFNLPRVSAQLEKLMGTNIVRLTDRNYMQQLRSRIQEEYHATLQKRIMTREAREMERERNLIMAGKGETCPHDLADHPVFIINQETNEQIAKARSKLKTTREKNAERLIRQGAKWEKEREIYDEMDRLREVQRKEKREAELLMEQEYANANRMRGIDLLRIKNRDYTETEMALKTFMDEEREEMMCRDGGRKRREKARVEREEQKRAVQEAATKAAADAAAELLEEEEGDIEFEHDEFENGFEGEFGEGEDDIIQLHPPVDFPKQSPKDLDDVAASDQDKTTNYTTATSPFIHEDDIESYAPSNTTLEIDTMLENIEKEELEKQHTVDTDTFMKYHYEDPKIIELRTTDDVIALYNLADEIIGGTSGSQGQKKKAEAEEED